MSVYRNTIIPSICAIALSFSSAAGAHENISPISAELKQQNTKAYIACVENSVRGNIDELLPHISQQDLVGADYVSGMIFMKTMMDCVYSVTEKTPPPLMVSFNAAQLFSYEFTDEFEDTMDYAHNFIDVEAFQKEASERLSPQAQNYFYEALHTLEK